jgi:hypothetical protein
MEPYVHTHARARARVRQSDGKKVDLKLHADKNHFVLHTRSTDTPKLAYVSRNTVLNVTDVLHMSEF